MKKNDLWMILILELSVVVIVSLLFRLIPTKLVASIFAGSLFIFVGVWINIVALKWSGFYRSATFWVAQVHLFFSAIPLFVFRMLNYRTGFSQIQIFGIPGPRFHQIATIIYSVLIVATLVDLIQIKFRKA